MFTKVSVCGRLTQDVVLKETVNKIPFVRFSVAVNNIRNPSASTTYVECTAWRNNAINMDKFLTKGSLVFVEGTLQSDNRQNLEVVANFVYFLDSKQMRHQNTDDKSPTNVETTPMSPSLGNEDKSTSQTSTTSSEKTVATEAESLDNNSQEKGIDWDAE